MNDLTITKMLQNSQAAVFTTQQLAVLMDMQVRSIKVKLSRLVKKGVLIRVNRRRYALPDTNILAIASGIYVPSYISLLAAFEYHGTTTQSPRIIDVLNPKHSGDLEFTSDAGSFIIRFIKVKPNLIFGFNKIYLDGFTAIIAEKEKAIVDGLMLPGYVPLDELVACIRSGIDKRRIVDYAIRTKRQVVMKRLGFLLSKEGVKCTPGDFPKLSKTIVPLDPSLPRRGKYDTKWKIILNTVIE